MCLNFTACSDDENEEFITPSNPKEDSLNKKGDLWDASLTAAGRLDSILGENILEITKLKINGPINGDDVKVLRQMLGVSEYPEYQRGKLTALDLSTASIIQEGSSYFKDYSNNYYYTVSRRITPFMFYNCENLTSIKLPKNVTEIFDYAFHSCSKLVSIDIPNGVTSIRYRSFVCCASLTSVTLPEEVTSIGPQTFRLCSSLSTISIPEGVTCIENGTFSECSSLTHVTLPKSLRVICDNAFSDTNIEHVYSNATIPAATDGGSPFPYKTQREIAILYVPKGTLEVYQNSWWNNYFKEIVEME